MQKSTQEVTKVVALVKYLSNPFKSETMDVFVMVMAILKKK